MNLPRTSLIASVAASLLVALAESDARAGSGKGNVRFDQDWANHPSARYAALSADACVAELGKRGIAFTKVARAPGVLAPVRLPKDVGGVVYRTDAPDHALAQSPYDVFDCRLVLALSDFSKVLRAHDVDEVRLFSSWRPPAKGWPEGKLGTRHPGALAADAARFGKKLAPGETERHWLEVKRDFHGAIGSAVCGTAAAKPSPNTPEARELRAIVCEAVDQHLFTVVLTPNYNKAHDNHVHLEVTPGVTWDLLR